MLPGSTKKLYFSGRIGESIFCKKKNTIVTCSGEDGVLGGTVVVCSFGSRIVAVEFLCMDNGWSGVMVTIVFLLLFLFLTIILKWASTLFTGLWGT